MRFMLSLATVFMACHGASREPAFHKRQLDGSFRSEGVALADINRDGLVDVMVSGFSRGG